MSQDIPPREQHPITHDALQQAYDTNVDDDGDHPVTLDEYHNILMQVQHTIERNYLSYLLQDARGSATDECIREDDAGWTFADYSRNTWNEILADIGIQRTIMGTVVREAHALEADRLDDDPSGPKVDPEKLPEVQPDNPEIIVIGKSDVWRDAEQHAIRKVVDELEHLVVKGAERHQALDYFMCESQDVHTIKQSWWADTARVSQPTISESISKARREIETPRPAPDASDLTDAEKRTIENVTDGEVTYDE